MEQTNKPFSSESIGITTDPEKLQQMAFQDELTKLPNHFLFKDRLAVALANGKRKADSIAVCYVNLVEYNKIKERFGQKLGDQLLIQIANRLASKIRNGDTICRYEGDKFLILLMSVTPTNLGKILTRLQSVFEEEFFITPYELKVTARIGVCLGDGQEEDVEPVIDKAKYAEQHAKLIGNAEHIVELSTSLDEQLSGNNFLAPVMFRQAIDQDQFVVHFQPQVDINQQKIIGLEALLRWNTPQYGLIYPNAFIEAAEKNGLIAPLGLWVIERVFANLSILKKNGHQDWKVAINLSPLQLYQKDFIKDLRTLIDTYSVNTQKVEFEITENVLLDNREEANRKLLELHEMGFQLAIDDFGTGFSNLEYLFSLEKINLIKIDKAFVKNIESNRRKRLVLENITRMINDLEQSCLIEGIETKEQLDVIQELGIKLVQGNYFSEAQSLEEVLALKQKEIKKWN